MNCIVAAAVCFAVHGQQYTQTFSGPKVLCFASETLLNFYTPSKPPLKWEGGFQVIDGHFVDCTPEAKPCVGDPDKECALQY